MRIRAVRHAVPARRMTNADCLVLARDGLRGRFTQEEVASAERMIEGFLDICGTETRRIRLPDERPLDLLLSATRDALAQADVPPEDIDFVIYTGVGRGWIEPALATVVQREMKLKNATAFDILDACASWMRAMHVSRQFLAGGTYRTGLIVNCECGLAGYLDLNLRSLADLETRLACFTIGEAATATVVANENPDDDFHFQFHTYGEHLDLCMIPLEGAAGFLPADLRVDAPSGRFYSRSQELISRATKKVIEHYQASPRLRDHPKDLIFTHAASERASQFVLKRCGVSPNLYFGTHREYGNTVSASVPLAMSLAADAGRLQRGTRTLVVVGSAGLTVAFATFTY